MKEISVYFPLELAYLCVNCNMVMLSRGRCPKCGSLEVWPLARWINREVDYEPAS